MKTLSLDPHPLLPHCRGAPNLVSEKSWLTWLEHNMNSQRECGRVPPEFGWDHRAGSAARLIQMIQLIVCWSEWILACSHGKLCHHGVGDRRISQPKPNWRLGGDWHQSSSSTSPGQHWEVWDHAYCTVWALMRKTGRRRTILMQLKERRIQRQVQRGISILWDRIRVVEWTVQGAVLKLGIFSTIFCDVWRQPKGAACHCSMACHPHVQR